MSEGMPVEVSVEWPVEVYVEVWLDLHEDGTWTLDGLRQHRNEDCMSEDEWGHRWICKVPDCGMPVEASVPMWLDLHEDGTWTLEGLADESATIACTEGHDNSTTVLDKSLSAFLEEVAPGTTWVGSDPRHREKGEEIDGG